MVVGLVSALLLLPTLSLANSLALLSGTLRTFQEASCDGDELRLQCPPETTISIHLVQYGRLASKPALCGTAGRTVNTTDCMDRSALKVVVAECGGKQTCQLQTSPAAFGVDPCPGIRKFVEVLYKCRPSQFRSPVVCQGQRKKISCGLNRIAIFGASFGVTAHRSVGCPQAPGIRVTDCQASFTSEKMIDLCQGRLSCELHADPDLFDRPCPADHNAYLRVTYTCVPKKILLNAFIDDDSESRSNVTKPAPDQRLPPATDPAPSTPRSGKTSTPRYDGVQGDVSYRLPPSLPPPPRGDAWDDTQPMTASQRHVIGFITEWITAYRFVSDNKEKFILYLTLSVTGGLLLCLLAVILRLYCQRRRARQEVKAHYLDPPLPHRFSDEMSEVDADIDLGPTVLSAGRLSPPYAGLSFSSGGGAGLESARYASSGRGTLRAHEGTLRAHDSDNSPRSLSRTGPSASYYYS